MRWWLAACVLAGCFSPHPGAGSPCPDGACPSGLTCSPATQTCEAMAAPLADAPPPPPDDAPPPPPDDAPVDAPPTLALVQQRTGGTDTGDTLAITLAAAPAAGHVLVLIGGGEHAPIDAVSGGAATWTVAAASTVQSNTEIWYAVADGTRTVSIHVANSVDQPLFMNVSEWAGLAPATLDAANHHSGNTGGPARAGSIVTTARDLIVFSASTYLPVTFGSPGVGYAAFDVAETTVITQHAYYAVEPAGSYEPSVTITGQFWDAVIAGFTVAP